MNYSKKETNAITITYRRMYGNANNSSLDLKKLQ